MTKKQIAAKRKTVLLVLFIPSKERDGQTPIDQPAWRDLALKTLGDLFGGATAFPKGHGVWCDVERGRKLVFDEPIVMHCYVRKEDIENEEKLSTLNGFCKKMGRYPLIGAVFLS